jgi:muconolactone delta-isomerase
VQYLVTAELVEAGALLPPDQFVGVMLQAALPSHDVVRNLMSEGKIVAGVYAVGERAGAFIFDVHSNAELDALLQSLPSWGLVTLKVTPLEDVASWSERDHQITEQMEQSLQR